MYERRARTTVGGVSATYGDDRRCDGEAGVKGRTADKGPRRAWVPGLSTARGASSVRPRGRALSGARAARARVARAASPAAVAAEVAAADGALLDPPLARYQARSGSRRVACHRAANRTPVALLSARRRRCCTSARSPRSRSPTSSGHRMNPTAVGPGC